MRPMVAVETIPAVYVKIENRPGTLEQVARIASERRLNIDALALETVGTTAFARVSVRRSHEMVQALRANHIEAHESDLVVATLPNRPGELARACGELSAARVNIEAVLTTPEGRVAFRTNDNGTALHILGKL